MKINNLQNNLLTLGFILVPFLTIPIGLYMILNGANQFVGGYSIGTGISFLIIDIWFIVIKIKGQ